MKYVTFIVSDVMPKIETECKALGVCIEEKNWVQNERMIQDLERSLRQELREYVFGGEAIA